MYLDFTKRTRIYLFDCAPILICFLPAGYAKLEARDEDLHDVYNVYLYAATRSAVAFLQYFVRMTS